MKKKSNLDTNPNEQLFGTKDTTNYKTLLHLAYESNVMGFVL